MKAKITHPKHPKVLVIDIGGSNVKFVVFGGSEKRRFKSGPSLTPARMVKETLTMTRDWRYDVISIGFPGPVVCGKPVGLPAHLGRGWAGFDFQKRFGKPVRIVNDAAMQALGCYQGGRMLFIGLGTGLGSALITGDVIIPLELCNLPYSKGKSMEAYLCKAALKTMGLEKWILLVHEIVAILRDCFLPDTVVIGGGNAKHLGDLLPAGAKLGHNENALLGGHRLWDVKRTRNAQDRDEAWVVA